MVLRQHQKFINYQLDFSYDLVANQPPTQPPKHSHTHTSTPIHIHKHKYKEFCNHSRLIGI